MIAILYVDHCWYIFYPYSSYAIFTNQVSDLLSLKSKLTWLLASEDVLMLENSEWKILCSVEKFYCLSDLPWPIHCNCLIELNKNGLKFWVKIVINDYFMQSVLLLFYCSVNLKKSLCKSTKIKYLLFSKSNLVTRVGRRDQHTRKYTTSVF